MGSCGPMLRPRAEYNPGFPSYGKDKGRRPQLSSTPLGVYLRSLGTPEFSGSLSLDSTGRSAPGNLLGREAARHGQVAVPRLGPGDTQRVGGGCRGLCQQQLRSCHSSRGSLVTTFAELVYRSCHREEVPWVDQAQKTSHTEKEEKRGCRHSPFLSTLTQ